jgi:hypothetical protein
MSWWYVGMMVLLVFASNMLFLWLGRVSVEMERSDYE